ncbi:hypothetical protein B0H12DRAFT_1290915 [Mycena haematopus]|nr:hypothetical protein B0H12DRAFT_1290915 [Mycena haematopus]
MGEHTVLQPPRLPNSVFWQTRSLVNLAAWRLGLSRRLQLQDLQLVLNKPLLETALFSPGLHSPVREDRTDPNCYHSLPSATSTTDNDPPNTSPSAADGLIPVPGAIIPNVGKDATAWKRAIDQWYNDDPLKGLTKPLKDWPDDWYKGAMRLKTGALYSNRKLLAEEYERLGSDDSRFMEEYPEYPKMTPLLAAIRQRNGRVRKATA